MARGIDDTILLSSVEAFVAIAAYENASAASKVLPESATTIQRRVNALEAWLRRILLIPGKELWLSDDGHDFLERALRIVELVDEGGLKNELGKTRVHGDGTITVEGDPIKTQIAAEIGDTLIKFRADLSRSIVREPIDGAAIDMSWYEPKP